VTPVLVLLVCLLAGWMLGHPFAGLVVGLAVALLMAMEVPR
jgi:hypothetical protein